MLQKTNQTGNDIDMFRNELVNIINMRHKLVILSKLVDWDGLEEKFSIKYSNIGRGGMPIRLMCGLLMLKEIEKLSDEKICEFWVENPYYQYFCGSRYFEHKLPTVPENLVYFRKRIGEEGLELLLQETIRIATSTKVLKSADFKRVTVDSTVQEKAITYPTDSKLYHKARESLVTLAEEEGIKLRQNYRKVGKKSLFMSARYSMSRKSKKAKAEQRKVRNYLGRVIRDIENKAGELKEDSKLAQALFRARLIYNQQRTDKNKIYSWHEDVDCISKGKLHKKYEFGCKVGLVVSSRSNFILGAKAFANNPYDGHTLKSNLEQAEEFSGRKFKEVYVDQGYKGHGIKDKDIIIARTRKKTLSILQKRYQKRRNAIEPVIGHVKNDGSRGARCYLKGKIGDNINAIAIAMGFNLRKLLNCIDSYIFAIISRVIFVIKHLFLQKKPLFLA